MNQILIQKSTSSFQRINKIYIVVITTNFDSYLVYEIKHNLVYKYEIFKSTQRVDTPLVSLYYIQTCSKQL